MIVKSFEDLDYLLPEDVRSELHKEMEHRSKEKEYIQQVAYEKYDGRPKSHYTNRRILPMLPMWMRRKLMEAREMGNNDRIGIDEDYIGWDHTMTLPLDENHVITFGIRDCKYFRTLDHDMPVIVDVYKDLQRLYRKYGHDLTLVCISSGFGGGELPMSFYYMNNEEEMKEYISGSKDSFIKDFLERFKGPYDVSIEEMEKEAIKYGDDLSENERKKFHTWFAYEQMQRTEYCDAMKRLLEASGQHYELRVGWKYVVIDKVRESIGEDDTYIKWRIGENLDHLAQFVALRPLLDKILRKISRCIFSFGIKPNEMSILSRPVTSS